jgi:hypothetical protein
VQVKVHERLKPDDLRHNALGRRPGRQIDADLEGMGRGRRREIHGQLWETVAVRERWTALA